MNVFMYQLTEAFNLQTKCYKDHKFSGWSSGIDIFFYEIFFFILSIILTIFIVNMWIIYTTTKK